MQKLVNEDLLRYRFLSALSYAPAGDRAAFAMTHIDEKDDGYKADLYLCENGAVRQLTGGGDAKGFIWEDENTLLFRADRDAKIAERRKAGEKVTVFQRIDVRGGEAKKAFEIPLAVEEIKLLPSGKYALTAGYNAGDPDFAALDDAGKAALAKKTKYDADYEVLEEIPFWSNGGGFTSRKRSRLAVFDPETNAFEWVTGPLMDVGALYVYGDTVYFAGNTFDCKLEMPNSLNAYNSATSELKELMDDSRYSVERIFLDGERIVFTGTDWKGGIYDFRQNSSLFALEGGKVTLVADSEEELGSEPASDCRYGGGKGAVLFGGSIYYCTAHGTVSRFMKMGFDGKKEMLFERDGSIDCFDINENGLLFIGMSGTTLQELYRGENGERLTSFNAWLNAERSIADLIPANFINSDGIEIEGYYMKPVDYEPGKTYPAILDIHGGPRVAYGKAFFHEMQVWANSGYFVMFCNPRGGDGRGEEFADIRGKYGTIDYDDLMAFTDHVLELCPEIDKKRLGVTGGSYGGYMTNWIIGHTDRFAVAASQRGIASWISKFGVTDIGYFFNAMQNKSTPWYEHDKMWWHSPLKYADKAKTPTLFIHSEQDYRCWLSEGLQMFTALRYHHVDSRLCMFRDENHELSRSGKPTHRLRRLNEMLNWFDKYIN